MNKYSKLQKKYLTEHGFKKFNPKAVLFDMDGVLLNSMPNHAVAWQKSMAEYGITMTADDAYATEGMRGVDTIRIMVKEQLGKDIDESEAQEMYDEKTRIFGLMPKAEIMPGVKELMEKVTDAGLSIIVVTGSGQRPLIKRLTEDFCGYVSEDGIITAYDVKQGKPAPDPYLMGLKKAGNLNPWEAIVVENAPLGVRAGVAAGIFTVAVNSGPLPDEALIKEGADVVFADMQSFCDEWDAFIHKESGSERAWNSNWQEIMDYMNRYKRRPSKYHLEDRKMFNWIKYNKKMKAKGCLSADREEKFVRLLELAEKYRRINQNAYMYPEKEQDLF